MSPSACAAGQTIHGRPRLWTANLCTFEAAYWADSRPRDRRTVNASARPDAQAIRNPNASKGTRQGPPPSATQGPHNACASRVTLRRVSARWQTGVSTGAGRRRSSRACISPAPISFSHGPHWMPNAGKSLAWASALAIDQLGELHQIHVAATDDAHDWTVACLPAQRRRQRQGACSFGDHSRLLCDQPHCLACVLE